MQERGTGRLPGAVVFRANIRGMAIPLAAIALLWLVCLAVSVTAEHSAIGKAEAGVLFGFFLIVTVAALIVQFSRRSELEVSHDTIVQIGRAHV